MGDNNKKKKKSSATKSVQIAEQVDGEEYQARGKNFEAQVFAELKLTLELE